MSDPEVPTAAPAEGHKSVYAQIPLPSGLTTPAEVELARNLLCRCAEALSVIVWTSRPDGFVDFANHHFCVYVGSTESPGSPPDWQRYLHPEDLGRAIVAWSNALSSGTPALIEYRLRRHDGLYRWFRVNAAPVRAADGSIAFWYGTATDIDDLRKLESESRHLAKQLTQTFESMTDAFALVDKDWRYLYMNRTALRLTGKTAAHLLGKRLWDEFPETVGTIFEHNFRTAMEQHRTISFEEFYAPLGKWLELHAAPTGGGLAIHFRDVTERRITEDELRAREQRLRDQALLLDHARDVMIVRDLAHRVIFWNNSASRVYGWSAEEAIGRSVLDMHFRDNHAAFLAAQEETLRKGEWFGELTQTRKDGTVMVTECRWTLMRNEDGSPKSVFAINTDITERRQLEQQFLRSQRLESIGTLAGGIAHDLNNLLSPIVMGVDMLRHLCSSPAIQPVVDNIEKSAQRGTELVKQVLTFARGVDGSRELLRIPDVFEEMRAIIETTFPKSIHLELSMAADVHPFLGDPTQINQVLVNLCVNARDAMPTGGHLRLAGSNVRLDATYAAMLHGVAPGHYVLIEVTDDGTGMPKEVLDRVFEPFFTTKAPGQGTGLGLSTSHSIIRSHGGFIHVESEVGKGTSFRIHLPAHLSEARSAAQGDDSAGRLPPRGNGECILIVDDEESILAITRQTLEAFGYRVITAKEGAHAISLFAAQRDQVQLVLTDMMMPVMDGPALIAALHSINPDLPIIAASGYPAQNGLIRQANSGIRHFLPKPYTAERLLELVHATLNP